MTEPTKDKLAAYFGSLSMGTPLVERGMELVDEYAEHLVEPIQHVFVSEYRDEEDSRIYESMWFFTENLAAEAHNFSAEDDGDIVPLRNGLVRVAFARERFDLINANEQSRFTVEFRLPVSDLTGILKATGENCVLLVTIFRSFLLPKLSP